MMNAALMPCATRSAGEEAGAMNEVEAPWR